MDPIGADVKQQTKPGEAPTVEELFVREDFSKPENRANVLLLAAASINPFWLKLHGELGLEADVVLRPEKNIAVGRPDLVVRSPDGKSVALIECENWGENINQTANYAIEGLPIILILGDVEKPKRGTTWAYIKSIIADTRVDVEPRQQVILDLLNGAINDILRLTPQSKAYAIDAAVLPAWLKVAAAPLLDLGESVVGLHAFVEGSASVRLKGPNWALRNAPANGVFLAMSQRAHAQTVFLAGPNHLQKHLSDKMQGWVTGPWTEMLRLLSSNGILSEDGNGRVAIKTWACTSNPEFLTETFLKLSSIIKV